MKKTLSVLFLGILFGCGSPSGIVTASDSYQAPFGIVGQGAAVGRGTAAVTSVSSTASVQAATILIPGNTLLANGQSRFLRVTVRGSWTNGTGAVQTSPNIFVQFGGVGFCTPGTFVTASTSGSPHVFELVCNIQLQNNVTNAYVSVTREFWIDPGNLLEADKVWGSVLSGSVDSTVDKNIVVFLANSLNSPSYSTTIHGVLVEYY